MKAPNIFYKPATFFSLLLILCSAANAQLKLYSTGSLSIGSITQPPPNAELQVIGNSVFSNNIGSIISSAYIKGMNVYTSGNLPDYTWWGDTTTGIFHPSSGFIAFSNNGNETMRLSHSNNLLIGTTSDNGDRVQVTGALNSNALDIYSNFNISSGYSGINWLNDTNTKAWAVKYNGQDKFYVNGNGQSYAYGFNTMSDSTLKENVHEISNALDKVLKLQGVTYNLKQSSILATGSGKPRSSSSSLKMGLIAQSVERIVPEAVTTTGDGLKTVAYGNLVGLLIEALKQEDGKLDDLQHKLDSSIALNSVNSEQPRLYPCKTCPLNETAEINCFIPLGSKEASLMVFDMNGALKKSILINGRKEQQVSISSDKLSAGMYYYSLVVDGKEVDTKKLILTE
ncbi:MAG TPA: tail fiber domain-containing protein [Bacteroidia bacterium]|nr:tail fiber domain-containing protein [Bacteroidia bacterium]